MASLKLELTGDESPTPMTNCPMTAALDAIGGKWSLILLYYLDSGTRRFNELRRLIPEVSHKVLTETLRNLEEEGVIVRTVHSLAPSHVEYEISEHGRSVLPVMHAVREWGRGHLSWRKNTTAGTVGSDKSITG